MTDKKYLYNDPLSLNKEITRLKTLQELILGAEIDDFGALWYGLNMVGNKKDINDTPADLNRRKTCHALSEYIVKNAPGCNSEYDYLLKDRAIKVWKAIIEYCVKMESKKRHLSFDADASRYTAMVTRYKKELVEIKNED